MRHPIETEIHVINNTFFFSFIHKKKFEKELSLKF